MTIKVFTGLANPGLVTDPPVTELPPGAWTDAKNVRFVNGAVRKIRGHSQFMTATVGEPRLVFSTPNIAVGYATGGGTDAIRYIDTGGTDTDISSGALAASIITGFTYDTLPGGVLVFNPSDSNQPVYSIDSGSGPSTVAALPNWPSDVTTCRVLRSYKSFLVAMSIIDENGEHPEQFLWSNRADPGQPPTSWDPADTTQPTGQATLPFGGFVQDAAVLRDSLIIYQKNNIYALTEVGGVSIMSLRRLFSEVGAFSTNCVMPWRNQHLFLSENGIFLHDGGQIQSVVDGRVRTAIFGSDFGAQFKPYLALNEKHNEIWICLPPRGTLDLGSTLAWVWNYQDNTWTKRDIPRSYHATLVNVRTQIGSDSPEDESSLVLADMANSVLVLIDDTEQFAGVNMTAYAERRALPLGALGVFDHRRMKFIREITPVITGTAGGVVNVYLGVRDSVDGTRVWNGPFPYTIGTSRKVNCRVSGRVIDIKFESTTNITWELHSYGIDYRLADARR